jgi:hypothetical protein
MDRILGYESELLLAISSHDIERYLDLHSVRSCRPTRDSRRRIRMLTDSRSVPSSSNLFCRL